MNATRKPSPAKYGLPRSHSDGLDSFSSTAMSPFGNYSERSSRKSRSRFSSVAKDFACSFTSCIRPSAHHTKEPGLGQFKDISISSVTSDGTTAVSAYSYPGNSYGGSNLNSTGRTFTIQELSKATRNFNVANKVGQGGFGTVYKGKLRDGTMVAIKRAKKNIYDRHLIAEFQSEIRTLSTIEHHNLVRFLGSLADQNERMIVVEYVPNGTLREHLDCLYGVVLDLTTRLEIAIDVAHAITYLHMYTDRPVIHRDIKSSNILLTENFRAKVADFGFSRLAPSVDAGATHISTQVKGTAGYLDPDYLKTYQLTPKSDVYSFGVLLVEILTGRRPIEQKKELKERITMRWALKKFVEGDAILALDPKLPRSPAASLLVEKLLELAFQCAAPSRADRPSMKKTVEILWNIRKDYRELLGSTNGEPTAQDVMKFASASSAFAQISRSTGMTILEESSSDCKDESDKISTHSHSHSYSHSHSPSQ